MISWRQGLLATIVFAAQPQRYTKILCGELFRYVKVCRDAKKASENPGSTNFH
jgi:hypothetical protein